MYDPKYEFKFLFCFKQTRKMEFHACVIIMEDENSPPKATKTVDTSHIVVCFSLRIGP